MRVLVEACVDPRIVEGLAGHDVHTAVELGWHGVKDHHLVQLEGYPCARASHRVTSREMEGARGDFSPSPPLRQSQTHWVKLELFQGSINCFVMYLRSFC